LKAVCDFILVINSTTS